MARGRKNQKRRFTINLPRVYIEWDDHHANGSWQQGEEVEHTPAPCWSEGYLYKEDKKGVTLIGSGAGNDANCVGNTQYILKRDITYRETV